MDDCTHAKLERDLTKTGDVPPQQTWAAMPGTLRRNIPQGHVLCRCKEGCPWFVPENRISHICDHCISHLDEVNSVARALREQLWANHGHSSQYRYGDDEELQCMRCQIWDYARADLDQLQLQAATATLKAVVPVPERMTPGMRIAAAREAAHEGDLTPALLYGFRSMRSGMGKTRWSHEEIEAYMGGSLSVVADLDGEEIVRMLRDDTDPEIAFAASRKRVMNARSDAFHGASRDHAMRADDALRVDRTRPDPDSSRGTIKNGVIRDAEGKVVGDTLTPEERKRHPEPRVRDGQVLQLRAVDPETGLTDDETRFRKIEQSLRSLRYSGYQPTYNGRPSCPFCGNFVDDEETHTPSCVLLAVIGRSEEDN